MKQDGRRSKNIVDIGEAAFDTLGEIAEEFVKIDEVLNATSVFRQTYGVRREIFWSIGFVGVSHVTCSTESAG